jgi:Ca-activated chloride channel family protein
MNPVTRWVMPRQPKRNRWGLAVATALLPLAAIAQIPAEPAQSQNVAPITIATTAIGDTTAGVVLRIVFRYGVPADIPAGAVLAIQGSILQDGGKSVRNFRYPLSDDQRSSLTVVRTLPPGEYDLEAKLLVPLGSDTAPLLIAKGSRHFVVAPTGTPYAVAEGAAADAIVAEGVVPEKSGTLKIRPPRRDVAPNLFLIDVDTKPPVKRVEFYVEGKKILTKNGPPYTAELDLGKLPKRVEVRAIGYDAEGRYIDADAWVVNERETPLEVKITRTITPDGIAHFKLSVQNPKNSVLREVALYADQKKLQEWTEPPYAVDIPVASLDNVDFVRASVTDATNYEASDLLFLSGDRYTEELEVNLVELPVTVLDASGAAITDLKQADFSILEQGKPQKISSFNFATNLPISVGVLVDHSGSMKPRMQAAKDAALAFFRQILGPRDRAFIAGFAWDATKVAGFASDLGSLESQVDAVPDAEGGTALYDAIVTGLYKFRTIEGRKALIVVSDGEDTTSRLSYDDMLGYVRASHVPLYFIGIGLSAFDFSGESKMKALAAETGGNTYFIKDIKRLQETYALLQKDLRTQYLLGYYAQSTKGDTKYRTVEVKVARPEAKVKTIRGFIP